MKDQARDEPIRDECRWNCARAGYAGFRLVELPSVEAAKEFDDGSVWFVFIDGSHEYAAVRADAEAWLPHVRPGGLVAFHDYGGWPGPTLVVTELETAGRLIRVGHVDGTWIGRVPQ